MIWSGHVVCMADMWNSHKIWLEAQNREDHLEVAGVDRRKILKWKLG
jgi:hypothetical protein